MAGQMAARRQGAGSAGDIYGTPSPARLSGTRFFFATIRNLRNRSRAPALSGKQRGDPVPPVPDAALLQPRPDVPPDSPVGVALLCGDVGGISAIRKSRRRRGCPTPPHPNIQSETTNALRNTARHSRLPKPPPKHARA